jgi:hypothetical protein
VPFEGIAIAAAGAGNVSAFVSDTFSSASFAVAIGVADFIALDTLAAVPPDGNRMTQNPGDASVNSNSTYPLALE